MAFQPGQSGNPGGRRKIDKSLQELARQHTPAAIAALVKALDSKGERVGAAKELLDRGWGKAPQEQKHTGPDGGPVQFVGAVSTDPVEASLIYQRLMTSSGS